MGKYVRTYNNNIVIDKEFAKKVREYKRLEAELKPFISEMKEELIEVMSKLEKEKIVSNGISANLTSAYVKTFVDTDLLKKKDINLYQECLKTTAVNTSVKLTFGE